MFASEAKEAPELSSEILETVRKVILLAGRLYPYDSVVNIFAERCKRLTAAEFRGSPDAGSIRLEFKKSDRNQAALRLSPIARFAIAPASSNCGALVIKTEAPSSKACLARVPPFRDRPGARLRPDGRDSSRCRTSRNLPGGGRQIFNHILSNQFANFASSANFELSTTPVDSLFMMLTGKGRSLAAAAIRHGGLERRSRKWGVMSLLNCHRHRHRSNRTLRAAR